MTYSLQLDLMWTNCPNSSSLTEVLKLLDGEILDKVEEKDVADIQMDSRKEYTLCW